MKRRETKLDVAKIDRLVVSRAVKLGRLSRLAGELGITEVDLITEARRQYADALARAKPELAPHLRGNLEGLIADLDAAASLIAHRSSLVGASAAPRAFDDFLA